jgi:hypothetical protein
MRYKKDKFNLTIFFISGILFMSFISAIKYGNNVEFGLFATMLTFLYGGIVGNLAITRHTSFVKNLSFFGALFFTLWTALNPVQAVNNIISIKSTEFQVIILLAIIFFEEEVLNTFRKMRNKPTSYIPGFIGIFAVIWILSEVGVMQSITEFIFKSWKIGLLALIVWWGFLINLALKNLDGIATKLKKWGK